MTRLKKQDELSDNLLQSFMREFYGYGNPAGKWWFIGMEEAGGRNLEEVHLRLNTWESLGRKTHVDICEYNCRIGRDFRFIPDRPSLSRTWAGLIRVLLSAHGQNPEREAVRNYQKHSLGRIKGDTYLVELLPLASPDAKKWFYGGWFPKLPYLKSRDDYEREVRPYRIERLKRLVKKYRPRNVLFYGKKNTEYWEQIAGGSFKKESNESRSIGVRRTHDQIFVSMDHPVAHGLTIPDFQAVGRWFANKKVSLPEVQREFYESI